MTSKSPTLIILGIRGVPAAHGGFETFAERLALHLVGRGWKVLVYCQGTDSGKLEADTWHGVTRVHVPVKQGGSAGTIEFDVKCVADIRRRKGTILTLGYNTGFLSTWLRASGRKNFINMDGIEWRREKYSKLAQGYLWINERLAAGAGTRLIADHPIIAKHLATRTKADRITMIPYGGEHIVDADPELLSRLKLTPTGFFTVIARPVPENSIIEIVRAFSSKVRNAKLAVLGTYDRKDSYSAAVLDAASNEVIFPGPIYDKSLLAALRLYSIAYLHGHQVGGTNPSLVEGLGAGNAVIAHDNPFNRWVAADSALYFSNESELDCALNTLIADPECRAQLQEAARNRWAKEFTWPHILQQYEDLLRDSA